MTYYLAFQHSHKGLEVGLFQNESLIATEREEKKKASKYITTIANTILKKNRITLSSLSFITANQGPGPFATLRVIISTINGISFASKIPLIGIDGIKGLMNENKHKAYTTVALLNAYSNDVYYAISQPENDKIETGYDNINLFLDRIKKEITAKKIYFVGNGAELFKEAVEENLKGSAIIPQKLPQYCSIEQIGKEAFEVWNSQSYKKEFELYPLYLKSGMYKTSVEQNSSD